MWLAMGWPCTVTPYSTSVPITRRTLTGRDYDGAPTPTPEGRIRIHPVRAQVDAYNARDIEAFVAAYADDVVITDPGDQTREVLVADQVTDGLISRVIMLG